MSETCGSSTLCECVSSFITDVKFVKFKDERNMLIFTLYECASSSITDAKTVRFKDERSMWIFTALRICELFLSLMSNSSNLGMKETSSTDSTCKHLLWSCFFGINSTYWQWTCRDSVLRFQLDLTVLSTAPIWRPGRKMLKSIPPKQLKNTASSQPMKTPPIRQSF